MSDLHDLVGEFREKLDDYEGAWFWCDLLRGFDGPDPPSRSPAGAHHRPRSNGGKMKHDHKLDEAIDRVTEYIAVSAGAINITCGIVDLHKEIDAAENILIILLRVKATLNKIEADASNGGPAESIRDLLNTMS